MHPGDAMDVKQLFLKSTSRVVVSNCLMPTIKKIDADDISFNFRFLANIFKTSLTKPKQNLNKMMA